MGVEREGSESHQDAPAYGRASQVFIAITSKKLIIKYGLAVAARQSPRGAIDMILAVPTWNG